MVLYSRVYRHLNLAGIFGIWDWNLEFAVAVGRGWLMKFGSTKKG
jgi:hypothetical protein